MTFILNLVLNGVMNQLWNVFNTLQILLALPLLAVDPPANVLSAVDIANQVVNFKLMQQEEVQEYFIIPLIGTDDEEPASETTLLA